MRLQNFFLQQSEKRVPLFLSEKGKEKGRRTWTLLLLHALSVFILETDLSHLRMKYPEVNSGAGAQC